MSRSDAAMLDEARRHLRAGDATPALALLAQIIKNHPTNFEAHLTLGQAALQLNQWQRAEASLAQAVLLRSDSVEAHTGHGYALRGLARHGDALLAFQSALELNPKSATCLGELGATFLELGEIERAERALLEGLELDPASVGLHDTLARLLLIKGDFDDAVAHLHQALSFRPNYSPALLKLAKLGRLRTVISSKAIAALLRDEQLHDAERRNLAFALGVEYEREGDYDRAFEAFVAGNQAQLRIVGRTVGGYRPKQREHEVTSLLATYSQDHLRRWADSGSPSDLPIFVIGMPRSGTTLVEQILASHPGVHGAGELPHLTAARHQFEGFALRNDGEAVTGVPGLLIRRIADEYLGKVVLAVPGQRHFVDKNPHNFENVGLVRVLLPNARLVHCWRDPADTCLSNFCQIFTQQHNYNNSLEDLGHYFGQYLRLMKYWYRVAPGAIYRIHYESLIANPEQQVRALLAHCGLKWHPGCLEFHRTKRPVNTPSQLQVRQDLYTSSVNRWKAYEAHLRPLLRVLETNGAFAEFIDGAEF